MKEHILAPDLTFHGFLPRAPAFTDRSVVWSGVPMRPACGEPFHGNRNTTRHADGKICWRCVRTFANLGA